MHNIIIFILYHKGEAKSNFTLWEYFIGLSRGKIFSVYQIIIENCVYMWTGTFNATINEQPCANIYDERCDVYHKNALFTQLLSTFSEKEKDVIKNEFRHVWYKNKIEY